MIISFLNYLHGRGNTSNCIATALNYALNYESNSILIDSEDDKSLMVNAFFNNRDRDSLKTLDYNIDSIANLIYSKSKLEKEDFFNYTKEIVSKRLDFLPGSSKISKKLHVDSLTKTIPNVIESASMFYDMVFIDVNSGVRNELTKNILAKSDYIIVSLEQNDKILQDFFESDLEYLKGKSYGIMIGKYDEVCNCSEKYISKKFKFKGNIFNIPYNTNFLNAINENNVYNFFNKNNIVIMKEEDESFFRSLKANSDVLYSKSNSKKMYSVPLGKTNILSKFKIFNNNNNRKGDLNV